jgi:hypothetical protein
MAEAVLELSDQPVIRNLASAIVTSQRSEITWMQELLERKGFPRVPDDAQGASGSPAEHGADGPGAPGGFFGSVAATVRAALLLVPVVGGVFAAAWLGFDAARRRHAGGLRPCPATPPSAGWHAVAVAGLVAGAALHLALASSHFAVATDSGVFFAVAALVEAIVAAAIMAWPSPASYLAGAVIALLLIVVRGAAWLIESPGTPAVASVDLIGAMIMVAELAAAIACLELWRYGRHAPSSAGVLA